MHKILPLTFLTLAACVSNECEPTSLERGAELYEDGRYEEAVSMYKVAVSKEPDNAHAHDLHGEALMETGRYEEALAALDRAVELDPEDAHAHGHRGQVLLAMGQSDQAVTEFEHAVRLAPDREYFQRSLERAKNR
ncbi:MAG: tetratricopeptide repeat protein [bacterium]|nr:tetratricopeptide repeat protein [bacterium]